ncbi:MAG: helix-turn-helix domain-containing protein [Defluviitaleaceae bacterium]|nr:helix-turn-helix domain-containing protein [Defluviitaleaceae bacterium]
MDKRYTLDYAVLAERIKLARLGKGYSQSKLAELVGVSTNTIGKLEINYTTVSLKTILNIANVLEVDVNYLVCDSPSTRKQANDLFIESLLQDFTDKDKEFIIQIISAVRAYKK